MGRGPERRRSLLRALVRAATFVALGVTPVVFTAALAAASNRVGVLAYDFHQAFLPAARSVLHGHDPYAASTARAVAAGTAFVYPPVAAYLYAPLAVLPPLAADLLATALAAAAVVGALWLLGVRDWRCHGCALLWAPVASSVHLAAITTLLALGVAAAWRLRDRPWATGVAVGLVVALKLFLWPLVVWLVATRRLRGAATAVGAAAVFVVAPWALLGFAGLGGYEGLLRRLQALEAPESCTVAAAAAKLGLPWPAAVVLGVVVGVIVLAAVFRSRREADALVLSVAAALLLSPIVWLHYFALLLVVVPLRARRFGPLWLLPLALWLYPPKPGEASAWQIVLALAVAAAAFSPSLRVRRRRRDPARVGVRRAADAVV
jgi:alpha-1,2-mannosyltransferase